jgi:hypothetical protein
MFDFAYNQRNADLKKITTSCEALSSIPIPPKEKKRKQTKQNLPPRSEIYFPFYFKNSALLENLFLKIFK